MTADASDVVAGNSSQPGQVTGRLGPLPYVIAILSVAPILGVVFGLIAIVWGLATIKRGGKTVAIIGAVGFCGQSLFLVFALHFLFG